MSTIPTESRIFADRYCREARRLEAFHAGRLSPGAKTWREAMTALFARLGKTRSPVKQATVVNKAAAYLASTARRGRRRYTLPPSMPASIRWWASRRRASASGST